MLEGLKVDLLEQCERCARFKKLKARGLCGRCYAIYVSGDKWWIKARHKRSDIRGVECPICHGRFYKLVQDHDHYCPSGEHRKSQRCHLCERSKLCSRCNLALGQVNEDPYILTNMIEYLEVWKKKLQERREKAAKLDTEAP